MAEFFEIRPTGQPALRSRIRNLQRMGLTPSKAGESRRVQYTKYDIYDLALALSLAEFGVDPKIIIEASIPGMIKDLDKAGKWDREEYVCAYYPNYFSTGSVSLFFEPAKSVRRQLLSRPRIAVINIAFLINRIDAILS